MSDKKYESLKEPETSTKNNLSVVDALIKQKRISNSLHAELKKITNSVTSAFNNFSKQSFVFCMDIRNSTKLMEYAKEQNKYCDFIEELIKDCKETVLKHNAIFDKFTGDGMLCHFITDPDNELLNNNKVIENVLKVSQTLHNHFYRVYQKYLHKEKLFKVELKDIGIGIGIDYGDVYYKYTNEFYAIGEPVVYACRLANAEANNTYLNINAFQQVAAQANFIKKLYKLKDDKEIYIYSREYSFERR